MSGRYLRPVDRPHCISSEFFIMKRDNSAILKTMTGAAVFSALALVVSFFFRLPVLFLTFDAKDAVITIASFIYGPVVAPIMSLVVALVEMVTYSETGMYGFIMNFASSATFSLEFASGSCAIT